MHHRLRKIRYARRWRTLLNLRRLRREEQGVQFAELSIALPIFLLLFGATAEFGRFFYEYSTLAKAGRVGARYLATAAIRPDQDLAAKNIVVYGNTTGTGSPILYGLTTDNVQVSRQGGVPAVPQTVTIEIINYKHTPIVDLGKLTNITSLSLNIDVKPSVTMRFLLTQPVL
jgi:Flp pilus assembly protein TadG